MTKTYVPVENGARLLFLGLTAGLIGLILPSIAADPPTKPAVSPEV
jgi:hypothetical protein